jgi:1-acyl-sn-glycerol-3-phosphate acyltransferase
VDDWKIDPAHDLGLTGMQRLRSLKRESGLVESVARLGWWGFVRMWMRLLHRLKIHGREQLPEEPRFVLAANHASHLDALALGCTVPLRWRDHLFPLAAGDVFFEKWSVASFAATCLNALPMWRRKVGRYAMRDLRTRILEENCIYILFPEGRRTRDGRMLPFKAGLGMLVAGTSVPVVPCYLQGTFAAGPPGSALPRPHPIVLRVGRPMTFPGVANEHAGWGEISRVVEAEVRHLAGFVVEGAPRARIG